MRIDFENELNNLDKLFVDSITRFESVDSNSTENWQNYVKNVRGKFRGTEPKIKPNLTPAQQSLAERIVLAQKSVGDGFITRSDIKDISKNIDNLCQWYGISFVEAINMLTENVNYATTEIIEFEKISKLADEFLEIYEKYYKEFDSFPINALSNENREFLNNKRKFAGEMLTGLSLKRKLELFLKVYLPEYANINLKENNYHVVKRGSKTRSYEELETLAKVIEQVFADDKKNIDKIFDEKFVKSEDFKIDAMFDTLFKNAVDFEEFCEMFGFSFTKIYSVNGITTVPDMIRTYKSTHGGSTRGMLQYDPYLKFKVDSVRDVLGLRSSPEFFDYFGIEHDSIDNGKSLSVAEIKNLEVDLVKVLKEKFPDGVIKAGLSITDKMLYDRIFRLASYRKMTIDELLESIGFAREIEATPTEYSRIYLTDRDMFEYGLLSHGEIPEVYEAKQIDVKHHLSSYQWLIGNHQDSSQLYLGKLKRKSSNFGE